jgi:hypothetical protein
MSANFEFRLIDGCIPMSRSLEDTKLGTISSVRAMNIEWKSDYTSAPLHSPKKGEMGPTFQELVFLMPIHPCFHFDNRLTFITVLQSVE